MSRFGWTPDTPDARDHLYAAPVVHLKALPPSVDLREKCPPIVDQGRLGSCTANAIAGALEFDQIRQSEPLMMLSRLFIYYNERVMEHTVKSDAGAMIRDGIKSVAKLGAPPEGMWFYSDADPGPFTLKPSPDAYKAAKKYEALSYARMARNLNQMKGCLASGLPFVFGFSVYESFESDKVADTGIMPMPTLSTEQMIGGHAVLAVGYDDATQRFIVRNSWGAGWGIAGYYTMPYQYFLDENLSDDMWVIKSVASGK